MLCVELLQRKDIRSVLPEVKDWTFVQWSYSVFKMSKDHCEVCTVDDDLGGHVIWCGLLGFCVFVLL